MIQIEIGKTYERVGGGNTRTVMGLAVKSRAYKGDPNTVYYEGIYWTPQGEWFNSRGQYVEKFGDEDPKSLDTPTWRDLCREVPK